MSNLRLQIGRKVDDIYCVEWTFFGADTAAYAKGLGYEGDPAHGLDFDAELTGADDGARLFALLPAFFGLALVGVDNGDSSEFVGHNCGLERVGMWRTSGLEVKSDRCGACLKSATLCCVGIGLVGGQDKLLQGCWVCLNLRKSSPGVRLQK